MPSGEDIIEMSGVETLHPGGLDLSRRIADLADLHPGKHILDVSSGRGVTACFYAQRYGCEVTGVDIKPEYVALSARRADKAGVDGRVRFRVGDSRELPFQSDSFDVVVNECAVGLTAIDDPQQVLNEMVRVTRPGGKVVIHESTWLRQLPDREKRAVALGLGTNPHAAAQWQERLAAAGAEDQIVEDWSGIQNYWEMRPEHKWNRKNPLDFLTWQEKLHVFPRIVFGYGPGALYRLWGFSKKVYSYVAEGYLGYTLIVAQKPR